MSSKSEFQVTFETTTGVQVRTIQQWSFVAIPMVTILGMILLNLRLKSAVKRGDARTCMQMLLGFLAGVCLVRAFIALMNNVHVDLPIFILPLFNSVPIILQFFLFTFMILLLHTSTEPLSCLADTPAFLRFHKPFMMLAFIIGGGSIGLSIQGALNPSTGFKGLALLVAGSIGGACSLYFPMLGNWVTHKLAGRNTMTDAVMEKAYFKVTMSIYRLGLMFSIMLAVESALTVLSGADNSMYQNHDIIFKFVFAACEIVIVWIVMGFLFSQSGLIRRLNKYYVTNMAPSDSVVVAIADYSVEQHGWAAQLVLAFALTNNICPCITFDDKEIEQMPGIPNIDAPSTPTGGVDMGVQEVKSPGSAVRSPVPEADEPPTSSSTAAKKRANAKPAVEMATKATAVKPAATGPAKSSVSKSNIGPVMPSSSSSKAAPRAANGKASARIVPTGEALRQEQLQITLIIVKFLLQCMGTSSTWQSSELVENAAEKKRVGKMVAVKVLAIWKKAGYPEPTTFLTPWRKVRISIMIPRFWVNETLSINDIAAVIN